MLTVSKFTFNAFQENTYLLSSENRAVLIDPGMSTPQEQQELMAFIRDQQLSIEGIWLTHAHIDHVLGLEFARKEFDVPISMHSLENDNLNSASRIAGAYGLPMEPFTGSVERYWDEMSEVKLGDETLSILFTPGHSAGSVSFYHASSHQIVSGDVLFLQSIGRTDLPGGDFNTLQESIIQQLYVLPEETKVFSGHGPETSIGYEKSNNAFVRLG